MERTFSSGTILYVKPDAGAVELGDIIVFKSGRKDSFTVHRVVDVRDGTIITRGDENSRNDMPIQPEDVIGTVVRAEVSGISYYVIGGKPGLFRSKVRWYGRHLRNWIIRRGPLQLYMKLSSDYFSRRMIRRFWNPRLRYAHFQSGNTVIVKVLNNRKCVAVWRSDTGLVRCKIPYHLVIDEERFGIISKENL